jgi:uncharacterized protein (AIM24 family)
MGAEKTAVGVPMLSGAELFKWGNRERSNFAIYGDDNQVVEVSLAPGEVVRTETGGLMHMHHMLEQEVTTDQGCMRCCCAGQSFFQSHFENKSAGPVTIALSPSYPAKIIPLDLARYSGIFLKKGAFLGAVSHDVRSIKFEVIRPPNLGTAFCGSGGLFLTRVTGAGTVFLNGGGAVVTKQLADGESIVMDNDSALAWEKTVTYDIRKAGNCLAMCCGGEGFFFTQYTGPGVVFMQSMPLEKLRRVVGVPRGARAGGGGADAGGAGN